MSVGLTFDGDHGCLGADTRLRRSLVPWDCVPRSLDSPVLDLVGLSVILAPACWEERVGDAGEARRGWEGIPRADARLLAIEEVSLVGKRVFPDSLGGCC